LSVGGGNGGNNRTAHTTTGLQAAMTR
jgi:hypothetical protein